MTGCAGFVAPRHLEAIRAVGGTLVAALDPHDAAGILDRYNRETDFFTEPERFDRYLHRLRRAGQGIDWLTVCSPNHLHDVHAQMGLRAGANVICEKPLTLAPWNLDALEEDEQLYGKRVYTVLQCRLLSRIGALKKYLGAQPGPHRVTLDYVTPRGRWYAHSWKGNVERSGGLITNIGVHMFDLLLWLFGPCEEHRMYERGDNQARGFLALKHANVNWRLSLHGEPTRVMAIDGEPMDFNDGFAELHTGVYEATLAGRGFTIADARPAVTLVHELRNAPVRPGP
jgi:UDP-N-acetyl-2-amino-2-deoxyglucuronate dehydrogenase